MKQDTEQLSPDNLLSVYYMSDAVLRALHLGTHLIYYSYRIGSVLMFVLQVSE